MTTNDNAARATIGHASKVTVGMLIVILTGSIANFAMIASVGERSARTEERLVGQGSAVAELKGSIAAMGSAARDDFNNLRSELVTVRERITRLESEIKR